MLRTPALKSTFDWADLAQEWRNHLYSYNEKSESATKSKHSLWAKKQTDIITKIQEPARKFLSQLDKLFNTEPFDIHFVKERIDAAYNYFFVQMDSIVYDVLWKIEEVKRIKNAKMLFDELSVLEEVQINALFKLMKAKLLVKTIASGDIISKENLTSKEIKTYKINKIDAIHEEFKRLNITLIDDNLDVERYAKKKKEPKEAKKSTVQETYELWIEKNSIKEIAAIRKLTPQTIGGHFAKLIESGTVVITDVLPEDKIAALAEAFFGYKEETLNPLKEKYGDEFTWDELKMYKSSLNVG